MTRVLLLRHGLAENPHHLFYGPAFPLTEQGRGQIQRIAKSLQTAQLVPDVVFCSPFLRTHQTADIVTHELDLPPTEIDDRLREWDVGPWLNKPLEAFHHATGYDQDPPPFPLPPEIEPLDQSAQRVHEVIEEKKKIFPGKTILLVSHREPLASVVLRYQQKPLSEIHRVDFPVSALWELAFGGEKDPMSVKKLFDYSQS
jgi:ribonuclease H / adenosylcobalamin/alpha-ribazole phosphatase